MLTHVVAVLLENDPLFSFWDTDQLMPSVWHTHKAEIYVRVKGILYDKSNESLALWKMIALDQQICLGTDTSVLSYASRFFPSIPS